MVEENNIKLSIDDSIYIKGRVLKALRMSNNMSGKEFASLGIVSQSFVSEVEKGKKKISDELLLLILDNLGVSVDFFYNLMSYAVSLYSTLKLNVDLSDEEKEYYFMQEILYIILSYYHERNIQEGFVKKAHKNNF